ncbi:hypothetical protein BO71DRAFT_488046 [Aspergillus ellipticus CBS 707.79]|uniref:Uncharacterized protein n=1 Tax=Aspergillus ellipticus CBS 707.79 TaxID=1448320 RepID=A0A319CVN7_9EURO|nr:hypothetical protein BO71DRAFT_488046 [Aspergillus ellipticus CBS 707.79]
MYRNSYLTIAVQVEGASSSGFFCSENVQDDSLEFQCNSEDGQSKQLKNTLRGSIWSNLDRYNIEVEVLWECRAFKASEDWPTRDISHCLDWASRRYKQILDSIVCSYKFELLTSDPFGHISSAELHMNGPISNAFFDNPFRSARVGLEDVQDSSGDNGYNRVDLDVPKENLDFKVVQCICLWRKGGDEGDEMRSSSRRMRHEENPTYGIGLALVPLEGKKHTYRRIGLIRGLKLSIFQDLEAEDFILV